MTKEKVIAQAKFSQLTENEQGIWEAYKHAMLTIFPKYNGIYDDETIVIAENAAFVFVDMYPAELKEPPVIAATTTTPTV